MLRKRILWTAALGVLYVGIMGAGTCGKQAREQIDSAKTAIEDARNVEAPKYAADEFRSAEESLLLAQEQYDGRRYRKAEDSAKQAEAQARLAQEKAMQLRVQAEEEERKKKEEEEAQALAYNVSSLYGDTDIAEPTEEEKARMALHDVHFDYDSDALSEAAKGVLALNAEWLKEHDTVKIEIEGHCDERGTEEYNLALGARRAKIAYDFMVGLGVDPGRMRTISYGESVPIDPGHTEEAWAKNRRAHFAVIQE